MRVLHLRDSGGIFGAERVILAILGSLDPSRFSAGLLCLNAPGGAPVKLVDMAQGLGVAAEELPERGRVDVRAVRALRKIVQERRIEVIHCHDFKSNFYGLLGTLGTSTRRVATAHGSTLNRMLKYYHLMDTYFTLRFFDRVITVSEKLTDFYQVRGFRRSCVVEVLNGLDIGSFSRGDTAGEGDGRDSPDFGIPAGARVLGTVGRLVPEKGVRILIEGFREIAAETPELFLLVVGDGPERANLERRVREVGLEGRVRFTGVLEKVSPAYRRLDVFVMPSLREGLPNVVLEAMFFRKPVVSTRVGSIPRVLEHGKSGFLVEPGSKDSLVAGLRQCLRQQQDWSRMAEQASRRLKAEYTAERMVRKIETVYLELRGCRNGG